MTSNATVVRILTQVNLPAGATELATAIVSDVDLPDRLRPSTVEKLAALLINSSNCPGMRCAVCVAPNAQQIDIYFLLNQHLVDSTRGPANALEENIERLSSTVEGKLEIQGLFPNVGNTDLMDAMNELAAECGVERVRVGWVEGYAYNGR